MNLAGHFAAVGPSAADPQELEPAAGHCHPKILVQEAEVVPNLVVEAANRSCLGWGTAAAEIPEVVGSCCSRLVHRCNLRGYCCYSHRAHGHYRSLRGCCTRRLSVDYYGCDSLRVRHHVRRGNRHVHSAADGRALRRFH